jgi:hypothetical protein
MLMRVDAMPPVVCFLSSRLLRLATMVDGVNIHGLHCASRTVTMAVRPGAIGSASPPRH